MAKPMFGGKTQGLNLFSNNESMGPKAVRSGHIKASQIDLLLASYQFQLNWNQQNVSKKKCLFFCHLPQLLENSEQQSLAHNRAKEHGICLGLRVDETLWKCRPPNISPPNISKLSNV